jgi:hypothetical protein
MSFSRKCSGHTRLVLGLLASSFVMTGCPPRVTKPSSDSTPPVVKWNVFNHGTNESQDFTGNAKVTAKRGDLFRVTLKVEDPEGVSMLSLGSSSQWTCVSGGVAQSSGPSLDKTDVQTFQPDSSGKVLTSSFLMRDANLDFKCQQSGFTFSGGSVSFFGTGENYFKGKTQATLVIEAKP